MTNTREKTEKIAQRKRKALDGEYIKNKEAKGKKKNINA